MTVKQALRTGDCCLYLVEVKTKFGLVSLSKRAKGEKQEERSMGQVGEGAREICWVMFYTRFNI